MLPPHYLPLAKKISTCEYEPCRRGGQEFFYINGASILYEHTPNMGNALSDVCNDKVELMNTLRVQKKLIAYLQERIDILHEEYNRDIAKKDLELHLQKTTTNTLANSLEFQKAELSKIVKASLRRDKALALFRKLNNRRESDIISDIFQEQTEDQHTDIMQRIKYYRHGVWFFQSKLGTILEDTSTIKKRYISL